MENLVKHTQGRLINQITELILKIWKYRKEKNLGVTKLTRILMKRDKLCLVIKNKTWMNDY